MNMKKLIRIVTLLSALIVVPMEFLLQKAIRKLWVRTASTVMIMK